MKNMIHIAAALLLSCTIAIASDVKIEPDVVFSSHIEQLDNRQEVLNILAGMIRSRGWRCDSISSARKLVFAKGFEIACNWFDYQYLIKDRGGQWVVTLK